MGETPYQEHKFDTLSLLEGLTESDSGSYSLEEILSEFGGESTFSESKKTRNEEEIVQQIQQAIDHEIEMTPAEPVPVISIEKEEPEKEEPLSEAEALLRQHGIRLVRKEQELPDEELPEKPMAAADPKTAPTGVLPDLIRIRIKDEKNQAKAAKKEDDREDNEGRSGVPSGNLPSALALYADSNKKMKRGRGLMLLSFILFVVSLYWTLAVSKGWSSKAILSDARLSSMILAGITLFSALLSFETTTRGFRELFSLQLRFGGAYAVLLLLTIVSCFLCKEGDKLPPCSVVCLLNLFALWGETLHSAAIRRSLRPLMKEESNPSSATVLDRAVEGCHTVSRGIYSEAEHVQALLSENHMQQQMDGYAAAALILSVSGAVVLKARFNLPVLRNWNLLLAALIPMAGFIGYERPFAAFARSLMKKDSAISGWKGAQVLKDADSIMMTDADLFPNKQVKLSGVKLFGNYTMSQASSYMAAAVSVSECGLAPVFVELRENSNGRRLDVTQFRRYEGGGIGAEITGDVVLIGSRRFMTLMGIALPAETDIRDAVYMSVNGKLAALFVLHYKASAKVHRAMVRAIKQTGTRLVICSRDFMITPKMLEDLFKIKAEDVIFPSTADRDSLAALSGRTDGTQGAILPDNSFDSLSDITIYAKKLGTVTRISAVLCMALSVISSVILFIMLLRKAVVTVFTVLMLDLIVAVPVLLLTGNTAMQLDDGEKKQESGKEKPKEKSNRMEKPVNTEKKTADSGKKTATAQKAGTKTPAAKSSGKAAAKPAPKKSSSGSAKTAKTTQKGTPVKKTQKKK